MLLTGSGVPNFPNSLTSTNALFQAADFSVAGASRGNPSFSQYVDVNRPSGLPGTYNIGYNGQAPTIGGGGTSASYAGLANNEALFFHNQVDLGDVVQSITATITPNSGDFFTTGQFRFSLDGHAPIIPEPSRAMLLGLGLLGLILRRKR